MPSELFIMGLDKEPHSWVNEETYETVIRPKMPVFLRNTCTDAICEHHGAYIAELQRLNDQRLREICRKTAEAVCAGDDKEKQRTKALLPCFMPMAALKGQPRKKENAVKNGVGMIDLDHVDNPREAWLQLCGQAAATMNCTAEVAYRVGGLRMVHITPSGKGLRIFFEMQGTDLVAEIERLNALWHFDAVGDIDPACKDASRLSYIVPSDYVLAGSYTQLSDPVSLEFVRELNDKTKVLVLSDKMPVCADATTAEPLAAPSGKYADYEVAGRKVADVVKAYIIYKYGEGGPRVGERHNAYGHLAMLFASMVDCKAEILADVIPQLDPDMTRQQAKNFCTHYCNGNVQTKYPQELQDFLKVYDAEQKETENDDNQEDSIPFPSELPPIFAQIIPTYQKEFREPLMFVLATILGFKCMNYYCLDRTNPNLRKQIRTLLMTVLLGGPNSGKSFKEDLVKMLCADEQQWQELFWARKDLWKAECEGKSPSKKPRKPQQWVAMIPQNSTFASLFENLVNAGGHGTFYNCSEASVFQHLMDSDPRISDLFRQNFDLETVEKLVATEGSEGRAELAMPMAVSSQIHTLQTFAKTAADIENGLITRLSIAILNTRESGLLGIKPLSETDRQVIAKTLDRIKADTFEQIPLCTATDIHRCKSGAEADKLGWKPTYKPMQEVNIDFIYPTIDEWRDKMAFLAKTADTDIYHAFYPRVAVRATRFALLLTILYDQNPKKQEVIKEQVRWWLETDMRNCLAVWSEKYTRMAAQTELPDTAKAIVLSVFSEVPNEFNAQDVDALQKKYGQKTEARKVISKWKKSCLIEKVSKNRWRKLAS